MPDGLFIERDNHRTWLKWHRARRRGSDPVFTGRRILEGMALGASVEVDLVVHGDGGMAVLHDLELDRETTGSGPVRGADAATLRNLHLRDEEGGVLDDRVMLLEDLAALVRRDGAHPDALLQLDYKEDAAALDPVVIANFTLALAPVARHFILSAGDAEAVAALAADLPDLRIGYDPCYGTQLEALQRTGDFAAFATDAMAAAPDAEMIYLHHRIVLDADARGFDMIGAFHEGGRRIDAYTIQHADDESLPLVKRLLALRVDQITTDDPEGLAAALR
ncbi:MAG TPA: glycerophosphodiester phosphodiesterase family protein [Devosiaceae bacterium]|jgi:glycerophosphoryl diester phosphodiesterase|nr:glycerophosphodiester phosphodiesterase family protein [Devosiaceae bacterium]